MVHGQKCESLNEGKAAAESPSRPQCSSSSSSPRLMQGHDDMASAAKRDEMAKAQMAAAEIAFYLKDEFDDDSCTLASVNTEVSSKVSLSTAGTKKPGAYWTLNSQTAKNIAKPNPQEQRGTKVMPVTRSSGKTLARLSAPQPVQPQDDNDGTNRRAKISEARKTCQRVEQILDGAFDALDPNLAVSRPAQQVSSSRNHIKRKQEGGKQSSCSLISPSPPPLPLDDESCTSSCILAQTPTELQRGHEVNRLPQQQSMPGAQRIRGMSASPLIDGEYDNDEEEEEDNLVEGEDDDWNELDRILDVDEDEWNRLDQPNTMKNKPVQSNLVVAAQLASDAEASIQDLVRQSILEQTPKAQVLHVEHGSTGSSLQDFEDPITDAIRKAQLERFKPRGVKEKLFGDGKTAMLDIGASPDDYIRKRDHLPFTVKQNATTNLWVASVQTNQKAWESTRRGSTCSSSSLDLVRSVQTFSAMTQEDAYETGLAMATPVMDSFEENPICFCCKTKFAVFRRPNHCRNCGVVVCSSCACTWSCRRLPSTYCGPNKKQNAIVCLACDWLAARFRDALLKGNFSKVKSLYKSGNVNLRHPYGAWKKGGSGPEILTPIHMAILGGNLDVVRWLVSERCCPLRSRDRERSILTTSKGRTPIQLALTHSNPEILRFLVVEQGLSLMGEDLRGDYRHLLVHLTKLLETVPNSLLQQDNDSKSDHSSSTFEQLNASLPNFGRSVTVEEKALVMKDPKGRRGSF